MTSRKINITDKDYPYNLRQIYMPPEDIYINGGFEESDVNAVGVVGSRTPTQYGLKACEKISYELALRGITVVSGMARGIDSAAHAGAIRAGGRTIAVMGSGHNKIYPSENKGLYEKIIKSGAVVSEYSDDTIPFGGNFPKRNRIISGLSRGVLVVEAARRSGSLITANLALEQGREVFAMPGNINSGRSSGTNALIKEGAKLVESAEDIIEELKLNFENKIQEPACLKGKYAGAEKFAPQMSREEKAIYDILGDEPRTVDDISEMTEIPLKKIHEIILKMELKKLAKALPGENFVRV